MAFRELAESLKLPDGASDRFRRLEALERMLRGEVYEDLKYGWEQEKVPGKNYVPLRERRPSTDFNLPYEITQDTLAELFGDEQFPVVQVSSGDEQSEDATKAVSDLIDACDLETIMAEVYETGVVGSVGVVVQRSDDGTPYYDILPGKWCEPVYRSKVSNELTALVVTLPIDKDTAEELLPGISNQDDNKGTETYWYRYLVGPVQIVEYKPLPDRLFANLGEVDGKTGRKIEFEQMATHDHGFRGVTPAIYVKNLGGKQRDLDGTCLWWPIRNLCIEIDYTLSQVGRGLKYCADPMLFVRRGELDGGELPAGYEAPAGGMATQQADGGEMVRGATQVLVGKGPYADAKLLEISAGGIKEEREYVRDLREYALEVLGGMKARAEHLKGAASGTAIDKGLKPLRRLVRRQRRPYGDGVLLGLIDLTLQGIRLGALDVDVDIEKIPGSARYELEWANDDVLQGSELLAHVTGLQMATGGGTAYPKELIKPEIIGAKLSADLGFHEPFPTIQGDLEATVPKGAGRITEDDNEPVGGGGSSQS